MNRNKTVLAGFCALMLAVFHLKAQSNNPPPTLFENFEQQTNTILVRGFSLIGTFALDNCTVSVRADEDADITHSQKIYGIVIEITHTNDSGGSSRTGLVVDYDELDSLADAVDYLSKVTWGVTQLNGFEASYATRSGFRIISHSDRRQDTVNSYIQFADGPRISASTDQLSQLRNLITQAKSTLDALK